MHCERTNNTRFLFPQLFDSKVFQTIPDNAGMGSFPEVRPKDARAQRVLDFEYPVFSGFLRSAALRYWRTPASKSENSRLVAHHWKIHPVHPSVPFPENHHHQNQIHPVQLSYGDGRSNGHRLPGAVSQLARNQPPLPTKRSGDHRCGF